MRPTIALLFLLSLGAGVSALPPGEVTDEANNFTISNSVNPMDWKLLPVAEEEKNVRAHFQTEFADSDPVAYCDFRVMVFPLPKDFLTASLEKISDKWHDAWASYLENPRDLKKSSGTIGSGEQAVECYHVEVQGDYLAGIHQVNYTLAKNGKFLYVLLVNRNYRAVGDAQLDEEVQAIRGSFRFLKVIKPEANKEAKGGDAPAAGPGGKQPEEEKIDPEKLKSARFKDDFWKFDVFKPEDLVNIPYEEFTENEKGPNNYKLKFERSKDQNRILITVAAQTVNAQQWTLDQLTEHKLENFKKLYEGKQSKEPEVDTKYKFPLDKASQKTKEAIRIDLVGRRSMTEKTTWIIFESKNERQYQIQIFLQGTEAEKMWKKQVDAFLKEFVTLK